MLRLAPLLLLAAAIPALSAPDLPGAATLPMVTEGPELNPRSTATAGFFRAKSRHIDQTLTWEKHDGDLKAATEHERLLVYRALQQEPPAKLPPLKKIEVLGREAYTWTVEGAGNRFVGTSFLCFEARVELTTFGAAAATVPVAKTHAKSVAGAECVGGGLGVRTPANQN